MIYSCTNFGRCGFGTFITDPNKDVRQRASSKMKAYFARRGFVVQKPQGTARDKHQIWREKHCEGDNLKRLIPDRSQTKT